MKIEIFPVLLAVLGKSIDSGEYRRLLTITGNPTVENKFDKHCCFLFDEIGFQLNYSYTRAMFNGLHCYFRGGRIAQNLAKPFNHVTLNGITMNDNSESVKYKMKLAPCKRIFLTESQCCDVNVEGGSRDYYKYNFLEQTFEIYFEFSRSKDEIILLTLYLDRSSP